MMEGKKPARPPTADCDESCTVDESESDNSGPEAEPQEHSAAKVRTEGRGAVVVTGPGTSD